jgi:hypothetical protein
VTAHREAELRHVITRCRGRITLASYRSAEQRALANLAAAALADLADALHTHHSAPSTPIGASQRETSRPTPPPNGSATSGGTRAPYPGGWASDHPPGTGEGSDSWCTQCPDAAISGGWR